MFLSASKAEHGEQCDEVMGGGSVLDDKCVEVVGESLRRVYVTVVVVIAVCVCT